MFPVKLLHSQRLTREKKGVRSVYRAGFYMQQLEQAVLVALQGNGPNGVADAALKAQAIEYLNQVKASPDGWQTCLDVFVNQSLNESTRLYALQVIDYNLPSLNNDQVNLIRGTLFAYYRELAANQGVPPLPNHMKSKLAQTMGYIFVLTYQAQWPTFFDDLLALCVSNDSPVGNSVGSDLFLKVMRMIHDEIGDTLVPRSPEETNRNNILKDLVRERAMTKLAESWLQMLQHFSGKDQAIVENALKVVGGWVSWIEISLVVGPEYRTQIFNNFAVPSLRISACNTLNEILSKKMKDSHKLELLQLLDFESVLSQLLPTLKGESGDVLEFEERLAKLTNTVGSSLVKICDSSECTENEKSQAEQMLLTLMPRILMFLGNEYDDTSVQVLGVITDYLQFLRKEVKKSGGALAPHRREVVGFMLEKIINKSAYDADADWTGGEDESESEFLDLRVKLKVLQEMICSIDSNLYVDGVTSIVNTAFSKPADGSKKPWYEIELGLYELDSLGESIRNTSFRKSNPRAVQALKELFFQMVLSDTVIYADHPSVSLCFMELVNKHSNLFTRETPADVTTKSMQVFLSDLGVHSSYKKVQVRAWYLFYRFIKAVRGLMSNISGAVFESLAPLLTVRARIPQDDSDDSGLENGTDSEFSSQLYLFELLGMLFGMSGDRDSTGRLLQSIFSDIERGLNQPQKSQLVTLQLHHNVMVIGSFAKGFEEVYGHCGIPSESDDKTATQGQQARQAASRPCLEELKNAAQVIAVTVDQSRSSSDVREASRQAFSRLVSLLGTEILSQVSVLIAVILQESSLSEFGDFLGFLGHYTHSFRQEQQVFEMFVSLIGPLVEKTFGFIKPATEESSGTDALIAVEVLRRAYLQFLFNVLNNGFGAVFIIEPNKQAGLFDAVIQSVYHYATDISDPTTQKTAVVALSKMLQVWNTGAVTSQFGQGLEVPIFSSDAVLEQLSSVAWTIVGKPKFNARDAQTRLVLMELGALQKSMYDLYGQRFILFLGEKYLPGLGLPLNLVQEYCSRLCELSGKDFKQYFTQFMANLSS